MPSFRINLANPLARGLEFFGDAEGRLWKRCRNCNGLGEMRHGEWSPSVCECTVCRGVGFVDVTENTTEGDRP